MAVETGKDGKMPFSRRSAHVAGPNSSRWNSSANEGLARKHDLPEDARPISLHAVARRGLHEELAVHATDALDLELLGFGLDLDNHQWAAFFRAVLPALDEKTLRLRWTRGDRQVGARPLRVRTRRPGLRARFHRRPAGGPVVSLRTGPLLPRLVRGAVRREGGDPAARFLVERAEQEVIATRNL
ncbi:hypothetical protein [Streptomyces exfoliatus]|uniref:hypothetical protein n=1 Tax=Streptomyces exfoliatus TaxID=1905 RepID=UPI003C2C9E9C